jgi:hypothetical protein
MVPFEVISYAPAIVPAFDIPPLLLLIPPVILAPPEETVKAPAEVIVPPLVVEIFPEVESVPFSLIVNLSLPPD